MKTLIANSFDEVYQLVCSIKRDTFENREIWFRGHGRNIFKLKPGLLRTQRGLEKEKEIFYLYKRFADRINIDRKDDWETLVNMQHYGIPTRLLDWTDNLGVALYFAYTSSVPDVPMSLYILDPLLLNQLSSKKGIPTFPSDPMDLSYMENYVGRKPFPARYPIAIKSNWVNDRVWAQSGMFTVHGDEDDSDIESILSKQASAIFKIDILPEAQGSLKEYFEISCLNAFTIYPDIQGITRHIRGMV